MSAFRSIAFVLLTVVCASIPTVSWADGSADSQAVEPNMHEFMEYVFEPGYLRLKANMAAAPADNKVWKGIKGDALSLAEAGNLLLLRGPQEKRADWTKTSLAVRTAGGELYQAARKKDYPAAQAAYTTMLKNCNQCHQQFANGKHQLAP